MDGGRHVGGLIPKGSIDPEREGEQGRRPGASRKQDVQGDVLAGKRLDVLSTLDGTRAHLLRLGGESAELPNQCMLSPPPPKKKAHAEVGEVSVVELDESAL